METLLVMYVLSGAILVGVSIPLIRRKIGPNPWYGFRVRQTLTNPEVWYPVNEFAAKRLLWLGIGTIIVAVGLYFIPNIDVAAYAVGCAAIVILGLVVFLFQIFRYLSTFKEG